MTEQSESKQIHTTLLRLRYQVNSMRWDQMRLIPMSDELAAIESAMYLVDDAQKVVETLMHPDDREGA